jgi:hypothetical protein
MHDATLLSLKGSLVLKLHLFSRMRSCVSEPTYVDQQDRVNHPMVELIKKIK